MDGARDEFISRPKRAVSIVSEVPMVDNIDQGVDEVRILLLCSFVRSFQSTVLVRVRLFPEVSVDSCSLFCSRNVLTILAVHSA